MSSSGSDTQQLTGICTCWNGSGTAGMDHVDIAVGGRCVNSGVGRLLTNIKDVVVQLMDGSRVH